MGGKRKREDSDEEGEQAEPVDLVAKGEENGEPEYTSDEAEFDEDDSDSLSDDSEDDSNGDEDDESDEDNMNDLDGDEYVAGVVSRDSALKPGDYEVEGPDGKITVVRGTNEMTGEQIESEDDRVLRAAKGDRRFDRITANRKLRFNDILQRAKASSELEHQNELHCSDEWKGMAKVPKRFTKIIQCKHGDYLKTGTNLLGNPRIRRMTEKELEEWNKIDANDPEPCRCEVCKLRRGEAAEGAPTSGLRSGKKIKWDDKYGPGRTLQD